MVSVSAQTPLLICCYFPCAQQADTGSSKQGKQFSNCLPPFHLFRRVLNKVGELFRSLFVLLTAFCSLSSCELSQAQQQHFMTQCHAGIKIHLPSRENHIIYHTSIGHLHSWSHYMHYLVTCFPSSVQSPWHLPLERVCQAVELASQVAAPSKATLTRGAQLTLLTAGPGVQDKF